MGFSKNKPKEVYNRKDVFIKHLDMDIINLVAGLQDISPAMYLEDLVRDHVQQIRDNKEYIDHIIKENGERIRKAAKSQ